MNRILDALAERIRVAAANGEQLQIHGGRSKEFLAEQLSGEPFDVSVYRGVVEYEPTELVVTARAGTPLAELEALLAQQNQMLGFEPPHYGASATVGGCVASGLSGPRRPHAGAVRDFVLGVRMLDGMGNDMRFGGKVIKNVAGYDVARFMAGSYGTLAVITEVSLRVVPRPASELTVRLHADEKTALESMNRWAGQPLPLSASCHRGDELWLRLSGAASAVEAARKSVGGEVVSAGAQFWRALREQTDAAFRPAPYLWRVSLPSSAAPLAIAGTQTIEWLGALRWLATSADARSVRAAAEQRGGSAILFRAIEKTAGVFHPLAPGLMQLERKLKDRFDPRHVFNPGRLYPALG